MAPEEDTVARAPDRFLSMALDILTDSVVGLDQLHPPMAQHVREDPNLPVELPAPRELHNSPGASSGERGIVIDTVADPRRKVSPIRLRGLPSPEILDSACLVSTASRSRSTGSWTRNRLVVFAWHSYL